MPVVAATKLLGVEDTPPGRYVTVKSGERRVIALAVDSVHGVMRIPGSSLDDLPPLLNEATVVSAISRLDAELLLVLRCAYLLPPALWPTNSTGCDT